MQHFVTTLLIVVIALISSAAPTLSQTSQTKAERKAIEVKAKVRKLGLGERVRVSLTLYNDTSYKGYVKEANEDDFVVVDKLGTSQTIRYNDVKSIGGRNLSTGAKIGIGVAIGVGAVFGILALLFASLND
ncbi:MAG: hypothetical protein WKF34_03575 [Pyrinomonadaceae bacterium]